MECVNNCAPILLLKEDFPKCLAKQSDEGRSGEKKTFGHMYMPEGSKKTRV